MADQTRKSRLSILESKSALRDKEKSFSKMRIGRQSYGFGKVPGITAAGPRTSQLGIEFKRPALMYFPTYQIEPTRKVKEFEVQKLIDEMLDENFTDHKYNVQESPSLALRLSCEIMREMKTMEYPRYRFIVVVTIYQRRSQCYNNAITFLWDHERDTYIDVQRVTTTAAVQVTAFAIYLD
ncbi:dynein light chain Tctex-type protein 2B-like [Leguminivora glycinivorella]|uniref:dynein light chain Tctex-type protein 2B-like n=1 Tax=Leguminivora glycinivorella TaxID=1035111 RepID=UPI00200EB97F|nr:dynein light chain Tctex-type protein 2B-like [Leguminivora glycinivorella]